MKRIISFLTICWALGGCESIDRAAQGAINEVFRDVTSGVRREGGDVAGDQSIETEDVSVTNAARTARDMGKVEIVRTAKNPKGQTQVALDSCQHPRIGELRCGGYLFEVTPEGWLKDEPITFDDLNHPQVTLAAGEYYIKAYNWDSGHNRFVTGSFVLEPFVTNYVALELE